MSISNDIITISGNIGNDPTKSETTGGTPVVNFRVGSSSGYFDRRTGAWVDGGTNWYAVSAFANLAEHAKASLRCGDPVIVSGRLKQREWEANGKKGFSVEIVADAIGHDLNRGTSAFVRRQRSTSVQPSAMTSAPPEPAAGYDEPDDETRDEWDEQGMFDPRAAAGEQSAPHHESDEEQRLSPVPA